MLKADASAAKPLAYRVIANAAPEIVVGGG
jgi:hypothetical protein